MSLAPIVLTPPASIMTPTSYDCSEQSSMGPERLSERYELISRLALTLGVCRPSNMAGQLATALRPFIPFDSLDIVVFKDGTSDLLWHPVKPGQIPPLYSPMEETTTWWVYKNQQPLHISDWSRDERFSVRRNSLKAKGVEHRSLLQLPLSTPGQRLGVLTVAGLRPHTLSNSEIQFLSLVANHVAMAVANTINVETSRRAQSELETQSARLQMIQELANSVISNRELGDALGAVAVGARRVTRSDLALVALVDADSGRPRLEAMDLTEQHAISDEATRCRLAEELSRPVLSSGKPWVGSEALLAQITFASDSQSAVSLRNVFGVPLVIHDQLFGVFMLGRWEGDSYRQDEIDFITQLSGHLAIAIENAVVNGELQRLKEDLTEEKVYLEDEIRSEMNFEDIVGRSSALQRALREVEIVAPTDSGVLILGETGTGKELIARAIHNRSDRRHQAFVKLNCAAIPSGLLESELFGHEKGAFTGAIMRKAGRFEVADKGTLFLDEVGDIPLDLQPKLLRVLQEREFERLGSTRTQQVDVRVIAATHRDLKKMVEDGQFRSDLFYRLHVFPLSVPPLRERSDDIPILVRYYVDKYARRLNRRIETIPPQAMQVFCSYPWPGNVRELQNFIERAVILSPGPVLRAPLAELKRDEPQTPQLKLDTLEQIEREHVLKAIKESNWVIGGPHGAAARLGMKRTTLAYRIRKLKIPCRPQ